MPIYPNNIPTILIVDDEPFNLEFLGIVLRQQGYNILTATNGRSGRELAEEKQPDLILLDIMMPDETGFECATVLRLSPETAEIPIIFLSALDDESNTSKGYDAGAVDFIVKPFVYKDVINRIRLHLKLNAFDKRQNKPQTTTATTIREKAFPAEGARAVYRSRLTSCTTAIHEAVVLNKSNAAHLILNCPGPCAAELKQEIRATLAENTGPLFRPNETLRNIGLLLDKNQDGQSGFSASYAHIDRESETLTVVNAGALPLIFIHADKSHVLIERQSGNLGSLGLGLLPCSSHKIHKGDRFFMVSRSMLTAFEMEGKGIRELLEAAIRHADKDMETACRLMGETVLKGGNADGILVGVEG